VDSSTDESNASENAVSRRRRRWRNLAHDDEYALEKIQSFLSTKEKQKQETTQQHYIGWVNSGKEEIQEKVVLTKKQE
jgi:hypothetical protein